MLLVQNLSLTVYQFILYELAAEFHSYWNLGKQYPEKRFINDQKNISQDKTNFFKS